MPLSLTKKDWKKIARWEARWTRKRFKKAWARRHRRREKQYVRDEYQLYLAIP
jgi:hypothetical protein